MIPCEVLLFRCEENTDVKEKFKRIKCERESLTVALESQRSENMQVCTCMQ